MKTVKGYGTKTLLTMDNLVYIKPVTLNLKDCYAQGSIWREYLGQEATGNNQMDAVERESLRSEYVKNDQNEQSKQQKDKESLFSRADELESR